MQDAFVFAASIKDNIAYGLDHVDMDRVVRAAKIAQLHDFHRGPSPNGYDTWVGERGVTLSGGQRQRLAIARTILLDPPVLILDDSTSSVDMETEHRLQQALVDVIRGRTTFVIAHRLSTVRRADMILALQERRNRRAGHARPTAGTRRPVPQDLRPSTATTGGGHPGHPGDSGRRRPMMGGGFGGGRWMGRMGRGAYSRGTAGRQGYEEDDEGGQIYDHTVVTRLFKYLLPHWPRLLLTLASVMVYTGAVVAIPWMVALIIDDYVQTGDLSGLNVIIPIFVGLALVQLGSQYLHLRTMAWVGQKVLYTLSARGSSGISRASR